jgi:histidinol-phosphate aminotransferase
VFARFAYTYAYAYAYADAVRLIDRVPAAIRASVAYHVPQPPRIVAKLDANELPYPLPAELRERLGHALAEVALERYPDPTARELRDAVSRRLGIAGDRIVFGNGSDELIAMIAAAFGTGPVLYPTPSFVYYRIAAMVHGLAAVEVPLRADFTLDEDALERAIDQHRPGSVFLALPNNPTGTLWPIDVVALARRHPDVAIVSDEAYVAYSGYANLPHANDNLIVLRTLSKVGMAGLRVGFSISSPDVAGILERVRPPYNLSALDQRAARFLIDDAWAWCEARAAEVVGERDRLVIALRDRFEVYPSAANFVLARVGDTAAVWRRLADAGIAVRAFGPGPLDGCVRITIGTPIEMTHVLGFLR